MNESEAETDLRAYLARLEARYPSSVPRYMPWMVAAAAVAFLFIGAGIFAAGMVFATL